MDESALCAFPGNECEALAMLYVKLHATTEHTPEELFHLYSDALDKIYTEDAAKNSRQYEKI